MLELLQQIPAVSYKFWQHFSKLTQTYFVCSFFSMLLFFFELDISASKYLVFFSLRIPLTQLQQEQFGSGTSHQFLAVKGFDHFFYGAGGGG